MKKRFIILFISLFLIPILMMLGESSWVIVDEKTTNISSVYYPFDIDLSQSSTYNGKEQEIKVTPDTGYSTDDLTYTYYDSLGEEISTKPKNAGTYYASIEYDEVELAYVEFVINKKDLVITANPHSITYGDPQANNGVSYNGFVEGEDETFLDGSIEYIYSYNQYDDVGTYEIIADSLTSNNYNITFVENELSVVKKNVNFTWSNMSVPYNGSTQAPTASINDSDIVSTDNKALTVSGSGKDVGEYQVSIENNLKNYNLLETNENPLTNTFEITQRLINVSFGSNKTFIYNKTSQSVDVTLLDSITGNEISTVTGEKVLPILEYKKSTDITWTNTIPTNAGTYEVKVVGFKIGDKETTNYSLNTETTSSTTFVINKATIDMSGVTFESQKLVYNGSPISIIVSGTLPEGIEEVIYENNTLSAAGTTTATAIFKVNENYNSVSNMTATLTVLAAKIKISFTATGGEYTYDKTEKTATIKKYVDGVETDSLPEGLTFVSMYLDSNDAATTSPINADTYKLSIVTNFTDDSLADLYEFIDFTDTVTVKINPLTVSLSGDIALLDYSETVRTWADISVAISEKIKFLTSEGNEFKLVSGDDFKLDSITDNNFSYDDKNQSTTNVVGSTYLGYVNVTSTNFNFVGDNKVLIKYRTAKVGNAYYTVEDAITNAGSSTIILAGEIGNTVYVSTSFTKLSSDITGYTTSSYTLKTKLRVPFDDVDMDYHGSGGVTSIGDNNSTKGCEAIAVTAVDAVYSTLYVPNGISLSISSTGILIVGGLVGSTGAISNRGILMNDGSIYAESSSTIGSYGFIKGTGTIELASGSTAIDVLKIWDWPGGKHAAGMNNAKIFPISAFSMHNISCKTIVNVGAEYEAFWTVAFDNTLYHGYQRGDRDDSGNAKDGNVKVIGSNALFILSSGTINKSAGESNKESTKTYLSSVTGKNQVKGQKEVLEINGECTDGSVSIAITASGTSFTMTTSTDLALPVSYMDITIKNGAELTLSTSSFKFLPGSSVKIENGGILNVEENVELLFYDVNNCINDEANKVSSTRFITSSAGNCIDRKDAEFINNGTLNLKANSYISALISTTGETGIINFDGNNYVNAKYVASYSDGFLGLTTDYTLSNKTYYANGNIVDFNSNEINNTRFSSGMNYKATEFNGTYGWINSKFNIIYEPNSNISVTNKTMIVSNFEYILTASDLPTLSRNGYIFEGWYYDSSFAEKAEIGNVIKHSVNLYAKWEIITYNIKYSDIYYENFATGNSVNYNNITEFNIEFNKLTTGSLLNDPINNNYVFGGWYLDSSCQTRIENIVGNELYTYLITDTDGSQYINLYALWYDEGTVKYVITLSNDNTVGIACANSVTIIDNDGTKLSTYQLPKLDENVNNNVEISQYFNGWYNGATKVTTLISDMFTQNTDDDTQYDLTLTANWSNKSIISVDGDTSTYNIYYYSGQTVTLNSKMTSSDGLILWTLSGGTTDANKELINGDSIVVTDATKAVITTPKLVTISYSSNDYCGVEVVYTGYIKENGVVSYVSDKTYGAKTTKNQSGEFQAYQNGSFTVNYGATSDGESATCKIGSTTISSPYSDSVGTSDIEIVASASKSSCIAAGTLITLYDGTKKKVEDLTLDDILLVFNHETGLYEAAGIIFIENDGYDYYNVINLEFSDGTITRLIYEHALFDLTLNKYVYITENNYLDFVGHEFAFESLDGSYEKVVLVNSYITYEYTGCYSLVTVYHMNYFIDGLFSIPGGIDGLFNMFEYDNETLMYDQEKMREDIETYGLYTYDDFKDYLPYEIYLAFPAQYFKVSVGKGMITFEEIIQMIETYLVKNGIV